MQFNDRYFDELSRSAGVAKITDDAADRVLANAVSSAPEDTGDYKRGLHREAKNQKRYVALVVGSDPKTMIIESKTGNLARALQKEKRR